MNQYAARAQRQDYIEQFKNKVFDWFAENPKAQKQLQECAEEESEAVDKAYIAATCDEYDLPCLEYSVHAPDFE